jgi:hypothetical protein
MRTKKGYQTWLYEFFRFDILVECPQCSKKAIVKISEPVFSTIKPEVKLICVHCGFNKYLLPQKTTMYSLGAPIDPFFQIPLWLTKSYRKNILWAYNYEHLSFLKEHIAALLRERNGQAFFNKSLASRLPKWMTSAKSRKDIIDCIYDLEQK